MAELERKMKKGLGEVWGGSFSVYFKTNATLRKLGQTAESGVFLSSVDSLVFFGAIFLFVPCRFDVLFSDVCVLKPEQNRMPLNCVVCSSCSMVDTS